MAPVIPLDANRWAVRDRYGNLIYLSHERWEHIVAPINHPEVAMYENELQTTIVQGKRQQDALNPQKYRYTKSFDNLVLDNTHIVAVVLFRLREDQSGRPTPNNYIVTAYQKEDI